MCTMKHILDSVYKNETHIRQIQINFINEIISHIKEVECEIHSLCFYMHV